MSEIYPTAEASRKRVVGVVGFVVGIVIALAIFPTLIGSAGTGGIGEYWRGALTDLLVLGSGFALAGIGYHAAKKPL